MTTGKKTLWSKFLSVMVSFALVFSMLFSNVGMLTTKADDVSEYGGQFIGLLYGYETSTTYRDQVTGDYKTTILNSSFRAANIV